MNERTYNIAILGATGLVGEAMIEALATSTLPLGEVFLLASENSAGSRLEFRGRQLRVEDAASFDWSRAQIALFSAGADVSEHYAPLAAEAGCIVIDNSSRWRYDDEVPLVVPEVNPGAIAGWRAKRIIANPNCSTIQLVVALKPLADAAGLRHVGVATYQAVSGAGRAAVNELAGQTASLLNGQGAGEPEAFPVQIAFNAIPHIDAFEENGFTREEMKITRETRKILDLPDLPVAATAVRIPVFFGHSEVVSVQTERPLGAERARELLALAPGVVVVDARGPGGYPTPVGHAASNDGVFVGRLRDDPSRENGLLMWVVADNVRKGAALNAVQIAETLVKSHL
ncbi:MAG: aspartate-semialdehyde dehydrogenase [Gammaproteobacteria bacterium]